MKCLITGISGFVGGYLSKFLIEKGYIVCRCSLPMEIEKNIIALPWQDM